MTRCALVTGVQMCVLPIGTASTGRMASVAAISAGGPWDADGRPPLQDHLPERAPVPADNRRVVQAFRHLGMGGGAGQQDSRQPQVGVLGAASPEERRVGTAWDSKVITWWARGHEQK